MNFFQKINGYKSPYMKNIGSLIVLILTMMLLQCCSWLHTFLISNKTNNTYTITYNINDKRGVFKDSILIRDRKTKSQIIHSKGNNQISFTLQPNQVAEIGFSRNSHYQGYFKEFKFDQEIPWKAFLNVDTLHISNDKTSLSLDTKELTPLLKTNNRGFARIELKDLIKTP